MRHVATRNISASTSSIPILLEMRFEKLSGFLESAALDQSASSPRGIFGLAEIRQYARLEQVDLVRSGSLGAQKAPKPPCIR